MHDMQSRVCEKGDKYGYTTKERDLGCVCIGGTEPGILLWVSDHTGCFEMY